MNRYLAFFAGFAALTALSLVPAMGMRGASQQAGAPAYEYEVLPGLQGPG